MSSASSDVQEIEFALSVTAGTAEILEQMALSESQSASYIRESKKRFAMAIVKLVNALDAYHPAVGDMLRTDVARLVYELEDVTGDSIRRLLDQFHYKVAPIGLMTEVQNPLEVKEPTMPTLLDRKVRVDPTETTPLTMKVDSATDAEMQDVCLVESSTSLLPMTMKQLLEEKYKARVECLVARTMFPNTKENVNDLAHWDYQREAYLNERHRKPTQRNIRPYRKDAEYFLNRDDRIFGFAFIKYQERRNLIKITHGPKEHAAFHGRGIIKQLLDGIKLKLTGNFHALRITVPEKEYKFLNQLKDESFHPHLLLHNAYGEGRGAIVMEHVRDDA